MSDQTKPDAAPTPRNQRQTPVARKPYRPPVLTAYGSVAKLTRGSRSINSDFPGAGHRSSSCL